MFNRKHYERIADEIKTMPDVINKRDLVRRFVLMFMEDNEGFVPQRFWEACNYAPYMYVTDRHDIVPVPKGQELSDEA